MATYYRLKLHAKNLPIGKSGGALSISTVYVGISASDGTQHNDLQFLINNDGSFGGRIQGNFEYLDDEILEIIVAIVDEIPSPQSLETVYIFEDDWKYKTTYDFYFKGVATYNSSNANFISNRLRVPLRIACEFGNQEIEEQIAIEIGA